MVTSKSVLNICYSDTYIGAATHQGVLQHIRGCCNTSGGAATLSVLV